MSAQDNQKPTISQLYEVGDFIDAKDNQGDWRVATIIDKSENNKLFKVRFDGWASKYDEFFKFGNPKLVQFRAIVIGYTGQKQNPATRPSWKFSLEQHQQKLIELSKIIVKNKEQIHKLFQSAHKLNQYLRGHNYLYVDFLMTNSYDSLDTINRIVEYFKLNVHLLKAYLISICQNFSQFIDDLQNNNTHKKYLQDTNAAFQWSFFQIFDTIYILMGGYPRSAYFFKENQLLIREYFQLQSRQCKIGFQIKMTQFMMSSKIFQLFEKILQKITNFQKNTKETIPFLFLHSLAHLFKGLSFVVSANSKQSTIKKLQKIGNDNILKLSEKSMKDFHKRNALQFLDCLQSISQRSQIQDNIKKWVTAMHLQIYYKMITCPLFDKKLKGINAIQQLCQTKEHISTDGTMAKWIQGKKILQILFLNDNPEIIKKSSQMIKYLYSKNPQFQRFIVQIWNHRHGKHQTAIKQIYGLIGEVPLHAQQQSSNFSVKLFNLISQVPQADWDQQYVKMIYNYSLNALFMTITSQKKSKYGFDIVYNYLRKGLSKQPDNVMDYLIRILQKFQNTDFSNNFIEKCFDKISNNQQQNLHVSLLLKIMKQKIGSLKQVKVDMRSVIQKSIVDFRNEKQENSTQKFQLMSQILKNMTEAVPKDQFIELWYKMIPSKSRAVFFGWLFKLRDTGRVILSSYINFDTKKAILQQFWTDQYLKTCPQIDQDQIRFLIELFKYVNAYQSKLQRAQIVITGINSTSQLNSLQKLWKIFESTANQKVQSMLSTIIAQVYMCKYITRDREVLEEDIILREFIQIVSIKLKLYLQGNNIPKINKMLILLEQILKADEQVFEVNQVVKVCVFKDYVVKCSQNGEEKTIRFNIGQNFYNFKKIVAQKFNLPLNRFDLINAKFQTLGYKSYFKSLVQIQTSNKLQLHLRPAVESQAKILLNHQLQLLFQLLGTKQLQERVWNIVSKLPISDQIQHKIIQSKNPLQTLKQKSLYKELYLLKVTLSLQNQFWQRIQLQKGLPYFLDKISKVFVSQIQREYLLVVLQIIQKMLQNQEKAQKKLFLISFTKAIQVLHQVLCQIQIQEKIQEKIVIKIIETTFSLGNLYDQSQQKQVKNLSINALLDMPRVDDFIILGLIQTRHSLVRKQFSYKLCKICTVKSSHINLSKLYRLIFQSLLNYSVTFKDKSQLKDFFNIACFILVIEQQSQSLQKYLKNKEANIFQKLFDLIKNEEEQVSSQSTNVSLYGYLSLIRFVLPISSINQLEELFSYVYNQCLFQGKNSKCKSKEAKNAVFLVLQKIIKVQQYQKKIIDSFGALHRKGEWRTRKLQDWIISQTDRLKSASGYVGLKNLGCICYMNSFFQQIFMIEQFRLALLLCDDPYYKQDEVHQNVLYQVKKMFINLTYSDKKAYNPKSFCLSFKDYQGKPTNVNEQMDIDQFSGILFDRLENNMKGTKYEHVVKNTFGGIFSNEIICKGCPHFSQTEETFLSISLTVKDKKNIYQSFDTMIKGDTLDGDNAYFCQRCSKKVSAVKRVSLKTLPNYLIVTLKRFQFDYQTMTKQKINEYCEFPVDLNLMEYSRDYLRKKQNPKFVQEQQPKSKSYFQYKLKGVVIHMGYADSGHYYSYIQQRDGEQKWFQFNDTQVRKFNPQTMAQQAFGGQTGGVDSKQKIKNAYMLIYERVQKINSIKENLLKSKNLIPQIKMYKEIFETIKQENIVYKVQSVLFSSEYIKFYNALIQSAKTLQLQKFVILVFLTTVTRSRSDPGPFETLQKIHKAFIQNNSPLCDWILNQFVNLQIYDQFFKNNPLKDMRKTIGYWLLQVFQISKDQNAKKLFLRQIILRITTQSQNTIEPLTIIYYLTANKKVIDYVAAKNIVGRLIENMVRKESRVFESIQNVVIPVKNQSYFGYETLIQRTPYEIAKKPKYQNQNAYAFGIIYKIVSRHSVKQLKVNKVLSNIEIDYLYLPIPKIFKILQQLKSKFQIQIFTSFLAYLSIQNEKFSEQVIHLVERGLKQYQAKRYRQFFILFQKFISIPDSLSVNRISWVKKIDKGLKQNEKYAMDCTIIELWICKIVNDNQQLRDYLIKEKQILQHLLSLPLKKVPSEQLSKKNAIFSETLISKLHGIPFPQSKKGYTKILKQIQKFYEQLSAGIYQKLLIFQQGPNIADNIVQTGAHLAYFDQKDRVDYEQVIVQNVFLHKLLINYTGRKQKSFWIWQDDQKLTQNLSVIKLDQQNGQNSSKTTEMDGDQIDFPETIPDFSQN